MWRDAWPAIRGRKLISIGIQLDDTALISERNGDLLFGLQPSERHAGERASRAMDMINERFGDGTIRVEQNAPHPGFFEKG